VSSATVTRRRDGRARSLLLVLVLLIASVLALVGVLRLGTSEGPAFADDAEVVAAADLSDVVPAAEEAVAEEAVADAEELLALPLVTYEVFLSRDPFQPVVPEVTPVAEGGDAEGETDGSGDDTDGSSGGEDTNGGGSTDPDAPACTTQGEIVCDGRVISLIDVTTVDGQPVAVIQVDTTVYEVTVGQTFAGSFLVRSIDGTTVTLLYGDEGIRLLPGDTVLK
jgi:hypothetical protein